METVLLDVWLGVCLCAAAVSAFSDPPAAENVHWDSLDFKTVLKWSAPPSDYTFTVQFSEGEDGNWNTTPDCSDISETECDLTHELKYYDRMFTANVETEAGDDPEEFPHTLSPPFNPYRMSELSKVSFTVQKVEKRSVTLNISDPLTGIHERGRQLTIRDVLKKDLKYKVSYSKSGSTGKRDLVVDSNLPQIPNLDPGQGYCFMVAAFVPSRDKALQQGAWSHQICTSGSNPLDEVELSTVFQAIFIPLVLLVVVVTLSVIYCRFCRGKRKASSPQPPPPHPEQEPSAKYTVV